MYEENLIDAIIEGEIGEAPKLTQALLREGKNAQEIMDRYLIPAMEVVGEKYEFKEYFVPEVLVSSFAMMEAITIIEPILTNCKEEIRTQVVVGTVKGDLHEIGKNIVAMMLKGAGFQVINVGVNVDSIEFIDALRESGAKILGMSCFLSTCMPYMKNTIEQLASEGLRDKVKVMVGGAAITPSLTSKIGADRFCKNAREALLVVKEWSKERL